MQQLINGEWVDCQESDLSLHEEYRTLVAGGYRIEQYNPDTTEEINIVISNNGTVIPLGDAFNFVFSFSDKTINTTTPVSIVNREGIHVHNISVTIVNGEGSSSYTPTSAIDYFITEKSINFHSNLFPQRLTLNEDFYIRVVSPS